MTMGEFPTVMKLAEVVPLYKSKKTFWKPTTDPFSCSPLCQRFWKKSCTNEFIRSCRTLVKSMKINMALGLTIVVSMQLAKWLGP